MTLAAAIRTDWFRKHGAARVAARLLTLSLAAGSATAQGTTVRLSAGPNGENGNGGAYVPSISWDGRYVAFFSWSSNLWGGSNGYTQVWRLDRSTGVVDMSSRNTFGFSGNFHSYNCSIAADGRFVAFYSGAFDLVPGDTNSLYDVFVRDHQLLTTERVSVSTTGAESNGASMYPAISGDGTTVMWFSYATNLVPTDTNGFIDVFVRVRATGVTERVSVSSSGTESDGDSITGSLSADGRFVAFTSWATNLVAGDTNGFEDVFVRDRLLAATTRISVTSSGAQAANDSRNPSVSGDGSYVAFESAAALVGQDLNGKKDVYIYYQPTSRIERVSVASNGAEANEDSSTPSVSADGRFVSFQSHATNLVAGDTNSRRDAFLHDRATAATARVSLANDGQQPSNFGAASAVVTADGLSIAFESLDRLVPEDVNGRPDVYLRERGTHVPEFYCSGKVNSQGCTPLIGFTGVPSASASTSFILSASSVINNKPGLCFYGFVPHTTGPAGSTLCIDTRVRRLSMQFSGGNTGPDDCSGSFGFDMNTIIQSGLDPSLVAGTLVCAQYLYRDPAHPAGIGLTNAIQFLIEP